MKFTKMSLVAALLVGSSAFAVDNVKVSGDFNVFYNTNDAVGFVAGSTYRGLNNLVNGKQEGSLFSKDNSAADIAISLDVTADLAKNDVVAVSAGVGATALSTLGLENNFVSNVWGGSHQAALGTGANYANFPSLGAANPGGAKVGNAFWIDEAWLAVTAGKTTLKLGRMELDTPLAFTETWSIEKNTFEAAVAINQDIPDTTLVAAWVGNGNGTEAFGINRQSNVQGLGLATGPVVNQNGAFTTYGLNGAYALGFVNNSVKPLTVQGWYYNVLNVARAYWLQADVNAGGILAGAQYASVDYDKGLTPGFNLDNDIYALMLGYEMKDVATIKVAYSETGEEKVAGLGAGANTATATGASKLYTEAWWNYGYITRADTAALNVTVEANAAGIDLGAYYTQADAGKNGGTVNRPDMKEFTATAGKAFGPLDATLAYIYTKADDQNFKTGATKGSAYSTIQAYLTVNF